MTFWTNLIFFTLIFGFLEILTNKYLIKYFRNPSTKEIDKLKISGLILNHYSYYYVIYTTIFYIILNPSEWSRDAIIIYFLFNLYVLFSWYYNNNKCFLTTWTNQMMGTDDDFGFRDPYDLLTDNYPETGDPDNLNLRDKVYYYYMYALLAILIYIIWQRI
tara:strand:+ start:3317 stop:3799 length:483 start_codon:yes stop_codon:yes gene_type:complete